MRNRYGVYGKHLELFETFQSWREDPALGGALEEAAINGTGAPEGRADFPIFLQTVIRFRMRERFATVASIWQTYMGVETAQDFRINQVIQVNGIYGIQPVGENGEYQRMRSSEEVGPTYTVAKHGGVYSVTFELVINDDQDYILNRAPAQIGRSAGEYQSQVFTSFIESNPTYSVDGQPFMSVARGNEIDGATAQPTEDNLVTAMETMQLRRTADNLPFTLRPRRILVRGERQRLTFMKIIQSSVTGVRDDSTGLPADHFYKGTMNPLQGILPGDAVVAEPWLTQPLDWYLLADETDRPAFIAAFLRGQQAPFIGLKDPGVRDAMGNGSDPYSFEFDSIDFKVRTVFAAAPYEPMAVMRMRPS